MALNIPYKQGGIFHDEVFVSDQVLAAGLTGDLVTIGTLGKITKLTYLTTDTTTVQGGISVTIDGNVAVNAKQLVGNNPSSSASAFGVFKGSTSTSATQATSSVQEFTGEFITISKDAGNTTQAINHSYVTGAVK